MKTLKSIVVIIVLLQLTACHLNWHYLPLSFEQSATPPQPDYGQESAWASLPSLVDQADRTPSNSVFKDQQFTADFDVFFIHPTTFIYRSEDWNGSLEDERINEFTNMGPMLHQASVFNGACRVYAPKYRQAHIKSFFHLEEGGAQAIALAYGDVKNAFDYYLTHYNQGRPIIIAAHSQGTTHAIQLLKDYFEGQPLLESLVVAYLVGMPVKKDEFETISPCQKADDCGCFVSWMTFAEDYYPKFYSSAYLKNQIHNPITWSDSDSSFSDADEHIAILTKKHKLKYQNSISAKPHEGLLWIEKPDVPVLKHFIREKIWHKADYNLFWVNIRQNVDQRCSSFAENPKTLQTGTSSKR